MQFYISLRKSSPFRKSDTAIYLMSEPIRITEDGLLTKVIIREGTGEQPTSGQRVAVQYEGKLSSNGVRFDSSKNREAPFEFTVGLRVIEGWSLGVVTMKVGELSVFTIDAKYGYGNRGKQPDVPPDATLIFEIELLAIIPGPTKQERAVAKARDECEQGNVAFREGRLQDALNCYCQGRLTLMFDGKDDSDPSYFSPEYGDVKIRLNRNLAVAYSRANDWKQSLQYAEEVLQFVPNDPKCLAKKIDAHIHQGQLGDARAALTKALGVTHSDPAFNGLRIQLEALEKEERLRENETFRRMVKK
jgi:peptidylprolyl isomerase